MRDASASESAKEKVEDEDKMRRKERMRKQPEALGSKWLAIQPRPWLAQGCIPGRDRWIWRR